MATLSQRLKRALADYQNLEKRHAQDKVSFARYANADLLDKLLPVLDDLERAGAHLKDNGLQLVIDQFRKVLFSAGVQEIDCFSQKFNPATMDCLEVVKGPQDQVVDVTRKGYLFHDQVLRPAQVRVGGGKAIKN